MPHPQAPAVPPSPWWRHGLMWLVVGGPAAVVLASIVTFWIAASQPDPVVSGAGPGRGVRLDAQRLQDRARMPAGQARNHAATPVAAP